MITAVSTILFDRPLIINDIECIREAGIKYIEFYVDNYEITSKVEDYIRKCGIMVYSIHSNGYNDV